MKNISLPDSTYQRLQELVHTGLEFHPPATEKCSHWSITREGSQIGCSCNAEILSEVVAVLSEITSSIDAPAETSRNDAEDTPTPVDAAVPSPAEIPRQPLTYTPPSYTARQDRTLRIIPATLEAMESFGLDTETVQNIIDDPDVVLPAEQWRSIYRKDGLDVIYSDRDHLVLSVKPTPAHQSSPESQPKLPGQKSSQKIPVPADPAEMITLLESHDFIVDHGGKHYKIWHKKKPGIYSSMPYTPSDYRWAQNLITEIKHRFDIDIRQAPSNT